MEDTFTVTLLCKTNNAVMTPFWKRTHPERLSILFPELEIERTIFAKLHTKVLENKIIVKCSWPLFIWGNF